MTTYPRSYHTATSLLVAHGASDPRYAAAIRANLAAALRWLRKHKGREAARRERYGRLFICGHFPDKPPIP